MSDKQFYLFIGFIFVATLIIHIFIEPAYGG